MPRVCTVCSHERRAAIDRALVEGRPIRRIAAEFGVAESSLHRHRGHIAAAVEAEAKGRAEALGDQIDDLRGRCLAIFDRTEATDPRVALAAAGRVTALLELLHRVTVDVDLERRIAALEAASATTATVVSPFGRRSA